MDTINKIIVSIGKAPVVEAPEILGALENVLKVHNNADTDKSTILSDNKGKAGIYQWKHKESNKMYVGSAVDLSKRLSKYYSTSELKRIDNYICRAIIHHTHSSFSLLILEYIDISTLSMKHEKRLFQGSNTILIV